MGDSQGHKITHDIDSFLPDAREALQHLDGHQPRGSGLGDYYDPPLCPIHGDEGLLPFASPLFGGMDPFSMGGSFGMGHGGIGIRMTMTSGMGGFRVRAQPFMSGHGMGMFGQSRQRSRFGGVHSAGNDRGTGDDGYTGPIITELPDDDGDLDEIDGNGNDPTEAPGPKIVEIEEEDNDEKEYNDYEQHSMRVQEDFNEDENVKAGDEPFFGPITSDISDYITKKPGAKNSSSCTSRSESVDEENVVNWQELDDEHTNLDLDSNEHHATPFNLKQQPKNKNTGLKKSTIKKVNKNEAIRPGLISSPEYNRGKERIENQFKEYDTNQFTSMDVLDGAQSQTDAPLDAQKLSKHTYNAPRASEDMVEADNVNFESPKVTPVFGHDINTTYVSADGSGMFTADNDEQIDSNRSFVNDSSVLGSDVDKNHETKYMPADKDNGQLSDAEQCAKAYVDSVRNEDVNEITDLHQDQTDFQMNICSGEAVKQKVLVTDTVENTMNVDSLGNQEAFSAMEIDTDTLYKSNLSCNETPLENVTESAISKTTKANVGTELNNAAMDETMPEQEILQIKNDTSTVTDNAADLLSVAGGSVAQGQTHSTADELEADIDDKSSLHQVTATLGYDTKSSPDHLQGDHIPKHVTQDTGTVTQDTGTPENIGTSEYKLHVTVQVSSNPDVERASKIVNMNKIRMRHHIQSYNSEDSSDDSSSGSYDCSNGGTGTSSEPSEGIYIKGQLELESSTEENSEYSDKFRQNWEYPSEPWPTAQSPHETEFRRPHNGHVENSENVLEANEAKGGFQHPMTREEMTADERHAVNAHHGARGGRLMQQVVNPGKGHHEHHHVVPMGDLTRHRHCPHVVCPNCQPRPVCSNCHRLRPTPHPSHSHARVRHVGGHHEEDHHRLQDDDWDLFDHPEMQWAEEFADPGVIGKRPIRNKNQPKTDPGSPSSGDAITDIPGHTRHVRQQPIGAAYSHRPINRSGNLTYNDRVDNLKQMVADEGYDIYDVHYDGNCLFEAVIDQLRIRGDFTYTVTTLRAAAVDYLRYHPSQPDGTPLLSFLTDFDGTWEQYLSRLSLNGEWGDHITISAISNVLGRKLVILGGTTSLHRTEMEPLQAQLNSSTNQDPTQEQSSQSNTTDSHVTQTGQYDVFGSEQEDLYLGHVFEAHYMSLRRRDWKQDLLELLKSKKQTLPGQDRGSSPKLENCEGYQTDAPMPHLTFVIMYTKLSDYFKIGHFPSPPSRSNSQFTGHISLYDGITSMQNLFRPPEWMYAWRLRMEVHDSRVHSPDTPLHNCGPKDLIVDHETRNSLVTRLIPVKPGSWLKKAVSMNGKVYLQQLFGKEFQRNEREKLKTDTVIMFPVDWPAESLHEYRNRSRPVNWPNLQIVSRAADMPCGMVPSTGRSAENHEGVDWEYSFYNAERVIAEDAVDSIQRFCYNVIMALINETINPDQVDIVHLRHTFFYFCEETSLTRWTNDPAGCMLTMIDKLRHCYQAKVLPHYFMHHHNMLENWAGDADQMESILGLIVRNPFTMMYFMLDSHYVLSLDRTPVVDRVVEDIQRYRRHQDVSASMASCFLPLAIDGIGSYISSKRFGKVHQKSVQVIDALESVSKASVNITLDNLIQKALKNTDRTLTRWLCAFVLDQNNGTEFTVFANEEFPTVSIFHFFGRDLAEHLQTFHGDIMIPSLLTDISDLAEMAWEFLEVLERDLYIPRRAYCDCVTFFLQHHGSNIIEFIENMDSTCYMKQMQLNSLKIILMKNKIFRTEEEMVQRKILMQKLSNAFRDRATALIEKSKRPEHGAEFIQEANLLLEEIKRLEQEWPEQSSGKTTRV